MMNTVKVSGVRGGSLLRLQASRIRILSCSSSAGVRIPTQGPCYSVKFCSVACEISVVSSIAELHGSKTLGLCCQDESCVRLLHADRQGGLAGSHWRWYLLHERAAASLFQHLMIVWAV